MKFGIIEDIKPVESTIENKLVSEFMNNLYTRESEVFESAVRTTAKPVIKGPITKGKIKWLGICIVKKFPYTRLEQRGKRISEKINEEPVFTMV